jgi:hypothetical protein
VERGADQVADTLRHGAEALQAVGEGAQTLGRQAGNGLMAGGSAVADAAGTLGRYALVGALMAGGVLHEAV